MTAVNSRLDNLKTADETTAIVNRSRGYTLPLIVLAQLAGTSLWFVPNAVMHDLELSLGLQYSALSLLTSSVQVGFIVGTLVFALLTVADRFSPSKVFFACSLLGALTNALVVVSANGLVTVVALRFCTGFLLAGIYPVGMKIASDHFGPRLGKALGWLLGALVLGTALPHLLKALSANLPWQSVVLATSLFALCGGLAVLFFVSDGPYRKKAGPIDLKLVAKIYSHPPLRQAAFGYFGHMWEVYTFWAFVPILVAWFNQRNGMNLNVSVWSFAIIASGAIGSIVGGFASSRFGNKFVAYAALGCSGLCCLLSPWILVAGLLPFSLLVFIWGFSVVPDSPQFSTMIAQSAPSELTGTALTLTNCIGFAITVVSLQFVGTLINSLNIRYFGWMLLIGPLSGILNYWLTRKRTV